MPPSSQFRLVRTHVAALAILELAAVRDTVLSEIGRATEALTVEPVSVIVFGSFARGEAGRDSDLDVVFVRPTGVGEHESRLASGREVWCDIRRDGHVVHGLSLDELAIVRSA